MNSETQLLALRAGDREALSALFETFADRIYRLAFGLLRDPFEADDVVQDTFLKVITHLDSFKCRSSLGTWMCLTIRASTACAARTPFLCRRRMQRMTFHFTNRE